MCYGFHIAIDSGYHRRYLKKNGSIGYMRKI